MNDKYLPIGTIVRLKKGEMKLMITSYLIFSPESKNDKKMYDYGGCGFPEGIVASKFAVGFNHEDIEEVIFKGLVDDEQEKFNKLLIESASEIKKKFENDELE